MATWQYHFIWKIDTAFIFTSSCYLTDITVELLKSYKTTKTMRTECKTTVDQKLDKWRMDGNFYISDGRTSKSWQGKDRGLLIKSETTKIRKLHTSLGMWGSWYCWRPECRDRLNIRRLARVLYEKVEGKLGHLSWICSQETGLSHSVRDGRQRGVWNWECFGKIWWK